MLIKAQQTNTRQTPRKLRLVANTVKDLPLEQALRQLAVIERRGTLVVMKVLKQAIANAVNNHGLQFADLSLKEITVTEGARYRRFKAVSRGQAHDVKKRTSHVTVVLTTDKVAKKVTAKKATPAPVVAQDGVAPSAAELTVKSVREAGRSTAGARNRAKNIRASKVNVPQKAV